MVLNLTEKYRLRPLGNPIISRFMGNREFLGYGNRYRRIHNIENHKLIGKNTPMVGFRDDGNRGGAIGTFLKNGRLYI